MSLEKVFLENAQHHFRRLKALGDETLGRLSDDELHEHFHKEVNSAAILIQHLSGNMRSRWTDFLSSDGEKPDRNRDAEFEDQHLGRENLMNIWEEGWNTLFSTLENLRPEELLKTVTIRGETLTVLEAIQRQLTHYAYHIGQLVYIGRMWKLEKWVSLSIPKGKSEEYNRGLGNPLSPPTP